MTTPSDDHLIEFDQLLADLLEERITAAGFARFQELLSTTPELRDHYIESVSLFNDLCGVASLSIGTSDRLPELIGSSSRPTVPRPVGEVVGSRPWLAWSITVAACIMALVSGILAMGRRSGGIPARSPLTARSETGGLAFEPGLRHVPGEGGAIATLIKLDRARWDATGAGAVSHQVGEVFGPRRLRLISGRATLAFVNGVMLTLEGPIDLDLVTGDRIFCRRGRLRARVPHGAEGFVVATTGSAVIDHGTEFAMNIEANGTARVMVFEGQAEAALLDKAGSAKHTQMVERSHAFEIDPRAGRIAEAVPRSDAFVAAIENETPALVLATTYPAAVLGSRPRGYWRFETVNAGEVPNEIPGGPPLRVHGPVVIAPDRRSNGFAGFRAGAPDQFLDTGDFCWALPGTPGHAVEIWFLAESFSRSVLVGLYPPEDRIPANASWEWPHNLILETTARERHSLFRPASVRFLHRWPLDSRVGDNICSDSNYVPRRWHHVVAQKSEERMELYLDGVEQTLSLAPDHPNALCHLVVGRRTPGTTDPKDSRSFVGRLDELALYDHPLSAEQVRSHFRLANP